MIFGLVKAINFSEDYFSTNLPALKTPELPSSIPTEDPNTLIGDLSPQCQAAFLSIIVNPEFFECVPVAALLPLLTDPTLLPSVLKDPITNLPKLLPIFDATCARPKCSDKFVNSSLSTLKTGCSDSKDA
ncbi:8950_t:CDS:1, partial [Racocetra fulgida]